MQKRDKSKGAQLTQNDLYQNPKDDQAALLNEKFWTVYNEQKRQATRNNYDHFLRTLFILVKPTFVPAGICQLVALTSQLLVPMCIMKLLQAIESNHGDYTIQL